MVKGSGDGSTSVHSHVVAFVGGDMAQRTIMEKQDGRWVAIMGGATEEEADTYLLSKLGQPVVVKEVLTCGATGYFCCRKEEHDFYLGKGFESFLLDG